MCSSHIEVSLLEQYKHTRAHVKSLFSFLQEVEDSSSRSDVVKVGPNLPNFISRQI